MLALARVPKRRRTTLMRRAIDVGVEFLLPCDPARAGFPNAYVTDVLQNLEALSELGHAKDPRARNAVDWLLAQPTDDGVHG